MTLQFDKIDQLFEGRKHFGVLVLRVFIGGRLLYGVVDNIISWDQMKHFAEFLALHGFPLPLPSAILSVYLQAICGLSIVTGFKIRVAALIMIINFIVALAFIHLRNGDSLEAMTPALAMLFGSLSLLFIGNGKDLKSSVKKS